MEESILNSVKKMLGISPDMKHFDLDIIFHINAVFMILMQLGIGPEEGFSIEDDGASWSDYLDDAKNLESVKSYVYLKTRMMFDPPSSSFVLTAMKEQASELEWRLNIEVDPQEVLRRDEIS